MKSLGLKTGDGRCPQGLGEGSGLLKKALLRHPPTDLVLRAIDGDGGEAAD